MPKTKLQKQDLVQKFTDKLGKSKSVVFANYKGMTMAQLAQLREKLSENSAEFSVTKNNLLKIALSNSGTTLVDEKVLEGPTATLFSYGDEVSAIKTLTKAMKDFQIGEVKAGFLDGEFLSASKINQLASLPNRDELRAKVVGSLGAPLYGIVGVLQGNLRNLVYALNQIKIARGGE